MTTTATLAATEVRAVPDVATIELMWPVTPVLAHPVDRPVVDGPAPFRLPLLDLVAAAVPDLKAHLRQRGLREVGYPTWFVTTGTCAGLKASLDEVLVCRITVAPIATTHESVTS